jgi:mannonate dehydratase
MYKPMNENTKTYLMEQTMRWFGPNDVVSLRDIGQAGCTGVVTALHHIPVGEIWSIDEIEKRKQVIHEAGMQWIVVESLPVHDDIKRQKGEYVKLIENYKASLENLAKSGLKVITYNFMPVLDWVRTNPNHTLPNGSRTLYFQRTAFVAFDLFLLKRPNAEKDYSKEEIEKAKAYFENCSIDERSALFNNILLGLPGSDDAFTTDLILSELNKYANIDSIKLKEHLFHFLREIVPVAEKNGLVLAIHPDDPPYAVLGLPRIVSTQKDLEEIVDCVKSPANGLCFCTGSLGARPSNDILGMLQMFEERIHFLHLRNTKRDAEGNFYEANHLDGDTDMVAIVSGVLRMQQKRQISIPMRPDHGHQMLDDLSKSTYPGYSAIGRLKALAELRGLERGIAAHLV